MYLASLFASSIQYGGSAKSYSPYCDSYFNHPFLSFFPFRNTSILVDRLNETLQFIVSVKSECDNQDSIQFWDLLAPEYRVIFLQKINFNFKDYFAQEKYSINWADLDSKTQQALKSITNFNNTKISGYKDITNIINYLFQNVEFDTCLSKYLIKQKLIKMFESYIDNKFDSLAKAQIERTDEIVVYKINSYYRLSSTSATLATTSTSSVFKIQDSTA